MRTSNEWAPAARFTLYSWGGSIWATKEQLQELGIGVGECFPGEKGPRAKQWEMETTDSRGHRVTIRRDREAQFLAEFFFSMGPEVDGDIEAFPGVTRSMVYSDRDVYVGTAQALVAAGLVAAGQFPGMPGMPHKTLVYIDASGAVMQSKTLWLGSVKPGARAKPGSRIVKPASGGRFSVIVYVPLEVSDERLSQRRLDEAAWSATCARLLHPKPRFELPERTGNVVSLAAWREARKFARE